MRRSSTSPATRAGAASRRRTARTRTSPRSSAAPTSADSRATDLEHGVAATAKHLVGHGLAEGGFNQAPAHAGPRELRDEQLLPFEAAVREAGIASVMPAYCDLDGVPCHASHELLTSILRDEWGFDGVVASDYTAVQMLVGEHRLTPDLGTAATMALRAGMDNELPDDRRVRRSAPPGGSMTAASTSTSSTSPSSGPCA